MEDEENNSVKACMSFDLGEAAGGRQMIIDYQLMSPNVYYVITAGNGPKRGGDDEEGRNDFKLRCFRLERQDDGRYDIQEYVTMQAISQFYRAIQAMRREG